MTIELLDLPGLTHREALEPGFAAALAGVASRLGLDPNYIGAVMSLESQFDPHAVNHSGGATGLIQFMPATAVALGTTTTALAGMSAIEQLPFVEQFYAHAGKAIRPAVPGDYYMATFLPAYVGKEPSFVLARPGDPVYDQNKALDTNHDGTLTVSDVTQRIENAVAAARTRPLLTFEDAKKKSAAAPPPSSPSPAPASPSGSSSPLSGLGGAANLRNLVVFAASCHLENVQLMVQNGDPSAVAEFVATLWDDVLEHASPRTASGTRILKYPPDWCGAFALHCLHEAELAKSVKWTFGPPHYGFLYRLHTTTTPEPGDIAYLDKPWQHHAIVTDVEGDTVHTIDGNQGPKAPIKTHAAPLHHWTAFYSILPFITEVMA